jgi:ABC-type lipoprotein export system ATPase subunit
MTSDVNVPIARAESANFTFGQTHILDEVDAEILAETQTVMTGRSGSGKTTLLLGLAGLIAPTAGTISWPSLSHDARHRRSQIGMVFQAPSLMPELSALQNVTLPLRLRGVPLDEAEVRAVDAMAVVSAADLGPAYPFEMSGGQQQRVAIARVLAGGHRLVLADEPTGALDRSHAHDVVRALRDSVAASGAALILATHDLEISAMFTHQLTIEDGRLVRDHS